MESQLTAFVTENMVSGILVVANTSTLVLAAGIAVWNLIQDASEVAADAIEDAQ